MPGILTCRGLSEPRSAIRSTCTITRPPEFRTAMAIASTSSVSASFSMVMLPSGSAVVPRMMPTLIGKRAIEEELLAVDLHQTNEIFLGAFVDLAAAVTRIDEGSEADAREMAGPLGGDVAEQMRDDALREIVGLDLVGDREALQLGHQSPVPADHAPHQAFMAEVIEAALLAVALARGIDQREIARLVVLPGRAPRPSTGRAPPAPRRSLRQSRCRRSRRSRWCRPRGSGAPLPRR